LPIENSYTDSFNSQELNQIINGCARNDRSAQERMYRMFQPKMILLAMRYTNDKDQAEDIVNSGFLKAFQKIDSYTFQGSFEGWLRKIVVRTALDVIRSNEKYSSQILFVEKDEFIHKDLGDRLYYNQLIDLVNTLPETARAVFNLNVMEGFPHKEIAEMLNMSEGTSKWYLSEARKMLKEKIEKLNLH
jgi:RNA polymerase sigma factor (sigma-70 family)